LIILFKGAESYMKTRSQSAAVWIARTAVLLALAVLFQSLRLLIPVLAAIPVGPITLDQLIIGTLVNLTLCIAAGMTGFWSGAVISILTPSIAFFEGALKFPLMIPFVAVGNIVIVLLFWLFARVVIFKGSTYVGAVIGAIAKTAVLWILVAIAAVPLLGVKGPAAQAIVLMFSWPQAITGAAGGILAAVILPLVRKGIGETGRKRAAG
jgi:hypothetical protein